MHKKNLFAAITASMSGFLYGYFMAIICGALSFISLDFQFSLGKESLFASILLLGGMAGSVSGGYLTDTLGRKKTFLCTCFLLATGCILLVNASSYSTLIFSRILQGMSIGIISVLAPLYLGEIAPKEIRGKFVAAYQVMMGIGILVAYLINYAYTPTANWKMMFLIGLIPIMLQFVCTFFIPESPLWLSKQKTVAKETKGNIPQKTLSYIFIIGVLLSIFQQATGINTIIYYAPRIFQHAGYTSSSHAMFATILVGVANLIGCSTSLGLVDKVGRKKLLLIGVLGTTLSLGTLSLFSFYAASEAGSLLSVVALLSYILFFAIGPGPITWVLLSEIYPSQIRDKAMTFSVLANWLFVYLILWSFPYHLLWAKISGTFGFYTVLNLLFFFFVLKYLPETKQKTLEEVTRLFTRK